MGKLKFYQKGVSIFMRYLNVRFKLNKNLDKRMAIEFLGSNIAGVNFATNSQGQAAAEAEGARCLQETQ